jgi:hypothetical protein
LKQIGLVKSKKFLKMETKVFPRSGDNLPPVGDILQDVVDSLGLVKKYATALDRLTDNKVIPARVLV